MDPHTDVRRRRIGGWLLGQELGRGGMGVVYAAVHEETGRHRALKVIRCEVDPSPEEAARFDREIRIGTALRHPHVVRMESSGRQGRLWYLVMERCTAGSLVDLVRRQGPLPAARAVPLFLGVLDGLSYAHTEGGAVHRDIKPQNLLLTAVPDGVEVIKIADFGLAKAYETAGLSGLTRTGGFAGTAAFMPRAQLVDFKYAKPYVDVWAAAASLYYALTGRTPRDFPPGRDPWLTVAQAPVVPVAERRVMVPDRLAAVLDQALDDDPARGFATADRLRGALREALPDA
ncbi:serine/threonine-protein kinase [Streptomyces sp. NPDC097704]|uniref:serine/threonine-protein kinase n=1 Tax=Streptomyces sp. NPDC097704 TaxID=3157101 RepID=UPI003317F7B4